MISVFRSVVLLGIYLWSPNLFAAQINTSILKKPKGHGVQPSFFEVEEVLHKLRQRVDDCPQNCPDTVQRWQPRALPIPEKIMSRVRFWRQVYSEWNYTEMAFHDRDDLNMVYTVIDVPWPGQRLKGLSRAETIAHTKKDLIRVLADLEVLQPTSTAGLNGLHRQVYLALMHVQRGDKYRRADLLRAQNGLRDTFALAIENSGRYRQMMLKILKANDLPEDLFAVVFVESLFQNRAKSYVGAAGLWQFMPRTGKEYMHVNGLVDERYDPVLATESAAKYLSSAFRRLGTWPLAISSYNVGVAGMRRAVRTVGTHDFGTIVENYFGNNFGFAARNYYSEVLAAWEVYQHRKRYFPKVKALPPWQYDVVRLSFPILFSHAVHFGGVPAADLRALNPALTKAAFADKVILPRGFSFRVPLHQSDQFLTGLEDINLQTRRGIAKRVEIKHKATGKQTLNEIAKKFRVSPGNLSRLMGIMTTDIPQKGTWIPIPKRAKNHTLFPRARHLPLPVFDDLVFASEIEKLRAGPRS
jgi:hypothetical protein